MSGRARHQRLGASSNELAVRRDGDCPITVSRGNAPRLEALAGRCLGEDVIGYLPVDTEARHEFRLIDRFFLQLGLSRYTRFRVDIGQPVETVEQNIQR